MAAHVTTFKDEGQVDNSFGVCCTRSVDRGQWKRVLHEVCGQGAMEKGVARGLWTEGNGRASSRSKKQEAGQHADVRAVRETCSLVE